MDGNEIVRQLRQLADLRVQGTITPEEFTAAKARLLTASGGGPYPSSSGAPRWVPGPVGGAGDGRTEEAPVLPDPGRGMPLVPPSEMPSPVPPDSALGRYRVPEPTPPAGVPRPQQPGHQQRVADAGRRSGAAIAVLAGGAVAFLSFVALPMASVPLLGSITGAALASHASDEAALGWLWLVFVASVAVTGLGAWQCFGNPPTRVVRRRASIVALICACLIVLVYVIVFASLQNALSSSDGSTLGISASDLLGAGFWFVLIGAIAAAAGAVVQLVRTSGEGR